METSAQSQTSNSISQCRRWLQQGKFSKVEALSSQLLENTPADASLLYLQTFSCRAQGKFIQALDAVLRLIESDPSKAESHHEHSVILVKIDKFESALAAVERSIERNPVQPIYWKTKAQILRHLNLTQEAEAAHQHFVKFSSHHQDVVNSVDHIFAKRYGKAEVLLRNHLKKHPDDVNAIRLLAEVAIKLSLYKDAEELLEHCLSIAPDFHLARFDYGLVLQKRQKNTASIAEMDTLLAIEPEHPGYLTRKATSFVHIGRYHEACDLYQSVLDKYPGNGYLHVCLGHAQKTIGEQIKAIASYRRAISLNLGVGEAYWSLANLKTVKFTQADIDAMRLLVQDKSFEPDDKYHLCFALAKALEDHHQYDESFQYYEQGNIYKETETQYTAADNQKANQRIAQFFDQPYFSNLTPACPAADPIFILGLPRSGSTLLEQILSSHSMVDGTKELPDIIAMAQKLNDKKHRSDPGRYPEILKSLSQQEFVDLGQEYLQRTQVQRSDAAYFIDKMPNNFTHIGFIRSILPNAKIIDARRNPMATCFSCYKQLFAQGQHFTYGLDNIGRYFKDYITLMDHWHQTLPGQVLTVHYEDVVSDFNTQLERILGYCGLPLEESCVEFYKTKRAVRTASSEQVRQPLYTNGLDQWKHYEEYLTPLKQALGPEILQRYNIAL